MVYSNILKINMLNYKLTYQYKTGRLGLSPRTTKLNNSQGAPKNENLKKEEQKKIWNSQEVEGQPVK